MITSSFEAPRDIRLVEIEDPDPARGEVVIRVRAAGICGSDLHEYRAGRQLYATPYPRPAQGHEFAGEVVALGQDVTDLRPGDRVAVQPMIGCGACERCLAGRFSLCAQLEHLGVARPGGFAELCAVPRGNVFPLPDHLPLEEAALLDCVAVAVHAVHRVPVPAGASVLVIGSGAIGLAVAQLARLAGAGHVTVSGRHGHSLEIARELGADAAVDVARGERLAEDFEVVFETAGGDGAVRRAVASAGRGAAVGIIGESFEIDGFDAVRAMERELMLAFCWSYDTWAGRSEFGRALDLAAGGRVRLNPAITHRLPLSQLAEAFEVATDKARSGAVKVLLQP